MGCADRPPDAVHAGDSDADTDAPADSDVATADTDEPYDPGPDPLTRTGLFVGIGDGGRWATSADGAAWEDHVGSGSIDDGSSNSLDAWRGVWSHEGAIVRVGGGSDSSGGSTLQIQRSDDGQTWIDGRVEATTSLDQPLFAVSASGGTWVAVGGKVLRSTDAGASWQESIAPGFSPANPLQAVAARGDVWIAAGGFARMDAEHEASARRSDDDGLHWSSLELPSQVFQLVAVPAGWIGISPDSCITSPDGLAWTECGLPETEFRALFVHQGEVYVAFKNGHAVSSDGRRWLPLARSGTDYPDAIAAGSGTWVALRYLQRGSSADRATWSWTGFVDAPLRALVFHPTDGVDAP